MEHFSHCCPKTAALPLGKRAVTPSLLISTGREKRDEVVLGFAICMPPLYEVVRLGKLEGGLNSLQVL
ncbi:hypothetical protein Tco_1405528 [Tanacetum coccineum]